MNLIQKLVKKQLIRPPAFLPENTHYLTMMGSIAYGVSNDTSDIDVYGFCIPPKELVFPHLAGEIPGFGRQIKRFEQYQQHHIQDGTKEFDISVYSVVKYIHLCMENNPNMIDSLFTPHHCVLTLTPIGQMVRENRRLFLHKGSFHKLKGYAYSQLHRIQNKEREGKRSEIIERYGYDVKFAYHTVRLLLQAEQILMESDLDLTRHADQLKAIRAGGWTEQQVMDFFHNKEQQLEELYVKSTLREVPDENRIRQLLMDVLEAHYGTLSGTIVNNNKHMITLMKIKEMIEDVL